MIVEVGTLVTPRGVVENARLEVEGSGSLYLETVVAPGFSDAHAHPQVVDVGEGRWSNSYEWMQGRRLRVDEAALRADIELSARLAQATLLRALLEGVTFIALVGRGEANALAYRRLQAKPRVLIMPTILDRLRGWPSTWAATNLLLELSYLDGSLPLGLFVHSLGGVSPKALRAAYVAARSLGVPFGIHLNEGVEELEALASLLGLREGEDSGIVAVHCIVGRGFRSYGIRVVHCPLSNLRLYGRTLSDPDLADALGSDWPLLLGSALSTYRAAVSIHGRERRLALLRRATVGGYEVYGIPWEGDWAGFDEPLSSVLDGGCAPSFVSVGGRLVVEEGAVRGLGLTRSDVDRMVGELVKLALERYPADG